MEETKFITLRVTPTFDRALRIAAARQDQNRSDFIRTVLAERLMELSEARNQEPDLQPLGHILGRVG